MSLNQTSELRIPDLQAGVNFLSRIPVTDAALAEKQLVHFLDALLAQPLAAGVMFSLLEQARTPVEFFSGELAGAFQNKPLPLTDQDEASFQQTLALWRHMEQAYAVCARQSPDEHLRPQQQLRQMATLLQRCLYYRGKIILEHYRARRDLPLGTWRDLHGYYEAVEKWGVAHTPVDDAVQKNTSATHCAAAYITLLLVDIAGAYSYCAHDLALIQRWASHWASLVSLQALDDEELPSYAVELRKDAPLHPMGSAEGLGADARCLDTTRLGLHIYHLLGQLNQGSSAAQLGLGETSSAHVIRLLNRLVRPWTQSASPRRFRRFPTSGTVRVALGFAAMHACISNPAAEAPLDEWSVINHSANGFRLIRSCHGQEIAYAQLMALLPHDGEQFLLCRTSWLMQEEQIALVAGVAMLPGMPVAISVRMVGTDAGYLPAFILPATPVVRAEASLILPLGLYQAGQLIEVCAHDESLQVRLLSVVERGVDYERVSYEPA